MSTQATNPRRGSRSELPPPQLSHGGREEIGGSGGVSPAGSLASQRSSNTRLRVGLQPSSCAVAVARLSSAARRSDSKGGAKPRQRAGRRPRRTSMEAVLRSKVFARTTRVRTQTTMTHKRRSLAASWGGATPSWMKDKPPHRQRRVKPGRSASTTSLRRAITDPSSASYFAPVKVNTKHTPGLNPIRDHLAKVL